MRGPAADVPLRVAVLASGTGTNLQAILDSLHGRGAVEVVAVASDKPEARALERARAAGVRDGCSSAPPTPTARPATWRSRDWLDSEGVELVVLAGYMQLLCAGSSARFQNRIINVHPALLPASPGSTRSARRSGTGSGTPA